MVHVCTEVWTQSDIRPKWPKFGSNNFEDIKRVDGVYLAHPPRTPYVDSWMGYIIKFGRVRLAVSRDLISSKLHGEEMSKFDPLEFVSYQPPPPTAPPGDVAGQELVPAQAAALAPALVQPPGYNEVLRGEEQLSPLRSRSPGSSASTVDCSTPLKEKEVKELTTKCKEIINRIEDGTLPTGPATRSKAREIGELLAEAQKVVARREEEKEKRKLKLMTQMVEKVIDKKTSGSNPPWTKTRGRSHGRGTYSNQGGSRWSEESRKSEGEPEQVKDTRRPPLPRDVCAKCGQVGHWKQECYLNKKEAEELTRLAACYEDCE